MAGVNPRIFEKFQKALKLPLRQEADGHEVEVEVREDEEQSVKLQEIVDLLVAAGYFRARIKGLSSFDKIVGGMTWCIESCNIDLDVDLLFQENSTIGQKIALTEKIIAVLTKIKCTHSLEPHQIQGLDFIHIYPVIQWLLKKSMEFRRERHEFVRRYAVNQFEKQFGGQPGGKHGTTLQNVRRVNEVYKPRRFYKCTNTQPVDLGSQVQITLLEYGLHDLGLQSKTHEIITKEDTNEHEEISEEDFTQHYMSLQLQFKDTKEQKIEDLKQKLCNLQTELTSLETEKARLEATLDDSSLKLDKIRLKQTECDRKLKELNDIEADKSDGNVQEIEELVMISDNLKQEELQFKESCKKELVRLQALIEDSKKASPRKIEARNYDEGTEKLKTLRLQVAKKNRVISALQRQIDDVPNRPELAQYQRRFLELYNQMSSKHKETKQYYTLYNTLEDTRLYMNKELSLLNSISDSYPEAVLSQSGKEEFLKQLQKIVEGVKQSKQKVEKQVTDEKRKRDQLGSTLHLLIEQQRKYVAAVRQLSIECKKHEALLSRT